MKTKIKWIKKEGFANQVIRGKGFFISYNKATGKDPISEAIAGFAQILGLDARNGEPETAFKEDNGEWKILKGDFRKEYEAAFPSITKCRAVYEKNKAKHRSNWSTDE